MEATVAVRALAALAHSHRLEAFRLLVKAGRAGLSAGDIALHLGLAPSSLSFHLAQLQAAGLIRGRRAQRHIFYALDVNRTRKLFEYLMEDCCDGRPELCGVDAQSPPRRQEGHSADRPVSRT